MTVSDGIREECCADWPKPCSYHEGWIDGAEFVDEVKGLNTELGVELDRLRPLAEKWEAYERMAFCQCCGALRGNCVCFGGSTTGPDGISKSHSCTPKDHGR